MAKGRKRSTREKKKPKAGMKKTAAAAPASVQRAFGPARGRDNAR
jgi:hypothetical protein